MQHCFYNQLGVMSRINVSYLVSYDYEMIFDSIAQLYDDVDQIVLGIDENFQTWSGNKFDIPDSFFDKLRKIDIDNKIEIFRDSFYIETLTPMECEIRERNMLLARMGKGWNIQLDVDEYILNFKNLKKFLNKYSFLLFFPKYTPIVFRGRLITLFRKTENGFLYINDKLKFTFITNQKYNNTSRGNYNAYSHIIDNIVLHQSWARTENEVDEKINNWGHRDDFDTRSYFAFWRGITEKNYKQVLNFHPLDAGYWDKLHFCEGQSIRDLIANFRKEQIDVFTKIPLNKFLLFLIKHYFQKIVKDNIKTLIRYDERKWLKSKYRRWRKIE